MAKSDFDAKGIASMVASGLYLSNCHSKSLYYGFIIKRKAMDINKVTLIGRLTRKPEARELPSGQRLASFTLATGYVWRDHKTKEKRDKTEYHRCIAWGKLAEIALTYLDRASRVYIEGRLQYRDWQDKEGRKRFSTDIIVDEIIMLGHNGKSTTAQTDAAMAKEEPSEKELVLEEV